jgi:putative endopeptidase
MLFTLTLGASAEGLASAQTKPEFITNAVAAEKLLSAADFYNPDAAIESILGDFDKNAVLTTANAYIMTDRAFGTLPAPGAAWILSSAEKPEFTDVPEAAKTAVENLGNARVILDKDKDGLMNPEEPFSAFELDTLITRIYGEYGTNPADDFHAAVNREYFADLKLRPGYTLAGVQAEARILADKQLANLLSEVAEGEFEQGTPEQKAADFYKAFMKLGEKDVDLFYFKDLFELIDEAEDTKAVNEIYIRMVEEMGYDKFFRMDVTPNSRNDGKNIYTIVVPDLTLKDAESGYGEPDIYKAAETYNAELLRLIEDSDPAANASAVTAFEKAVVADSLAPEDIYNVNKAYKVHTLEDIQKTMPDWDLSVLLKAMNQPAGSDKLVLVPDDGKLAAFAKIFEPENIGLLKTFLKLDIARKYRNYLGDSFRKARDIFLQDSMGITPLAKNDYYVNQASEEMNLLMQKIYAEHYVDPRTKTDVEKMANGIIETFYSRMDNYTWMSESTREEAKKKLEKLRVVAAYPDKMYSAWDDIDVTPKDALLIKTDYAKAVFKMDTTGYGETPDYDLIIMNQTKTYESNAWFFPELNTIYFASGFLVPPIYDPNASLASNLGSIGVVMGHEISHAFDNNGSQYDSNGIIRNWWTEDDFSEFNGRVKTIVTHFDGKEFAPGIMNNPVLTVGENIADIGGVSVALQYLKEHSENPDYDAFFKNWAVLWGNARVYQRAISISQYDQHSGDKVRVNAVLALFDEFYETYDIKPGDGMYIPPEKRVSIW